MHVEVQLRQTKYLKKKEEETWEVGKTKGESPR